jgi:hypothetical protein
MLIDCFEVVLLMLIGCFDVILLLFWGGPIDALWLF